MTSSAPIAKAAVTGAGGFIGQALVRRLVESGAEVSAVDQRPFEAPGARALVRDVSAPGSLDDLLDKDTVVFHLASPASVPGSVADPKGDFKHGLAGFLEVLEAARARGARGILFPSTASIFDPSNPQPVSEKAYVRPTSPYSAGKLGGEAYASAYFRSYGLDVRVARLFSVYGIGARRLAVFDLIKKVLEDPRELSILGDGKQVRDFLYVDDVVEGFLDVMTHGEPGEDYNLGSGEPVVLLDLARRIAALMGHPGIRLLPTGKSFPGDVFQWYGDVSKVRGIGFRPRVSLEEGLKRTISWLAGIPAA